MSINTKHVAALLAASAMAFGISVHAEPGAMQCEGMGMSGKHMMGDHAAHAEKRLADFKTQLKITPQQEPLWQAFAEKVKANAGQHMKGMQEKMQQPATAPERMDRMTQHMKEHLAAVEAVSESFKRLYDALSPEQKAVADKFQPFGDHMGKRGPRGQMGGGMNGKGGGMGGGMGPGGQAPARQ